MKLKATLLVGFVGALGFASDAAAVTTCTFTTTGSTMKLDADCTTDQTILIPNGFTLDGKGRSITAIDPPAGTFLGAVVRNGGTTANVKNLTVTAAGLAIACHTSVPDERLRGILFDGASGTIEKNVVIGVNQGLSGCQEGNAIEVRNAPFDGTHPNTQTAKIVKNRVEDYQKGGIIANGDVSVTIEQNDVIGSGPINYIAQNGIQIGFGGLGKVKNNSISNMQFTPQTFADAGILLFSASPGVEVSHNKVEDVDVNIWLILVDDAKVEHNDVSGSTFDGIFLDTVTTSTVAHNKIKTSSTGGAGFGAGVGLFDSVDNTVAKNDAKENGDDGFSANSGSTGNTFEQNKADNNVGFGYRDASVGAGTAGTANTYQKNKAKNNGAGASSPPGLAS